MRRLLLYSLLIFFSGKAEGQIIALYKNIYDISVQKDTIVEIAYLREIDSALVTKLDSFKKFHQTRAKYDTGNFFYVVDFSKRSKGMGVAISCNSTYNNYLMLTAGKLYDRRETVFAYAFYHNELVLFSTTRQSCHLSDCSVLLLKNLIYEHLPHVEQKKIIQNPEVVEIRTEPVNWYYIVGVDGR